MPTRCSEIILFLLFLTTTTTFVSSWISQINLPGVTSESLVDLRRRANPTKPDNIMVPVNYGAYTNGTFPPTDFVLPNTGNPSQHASFYAFGGAPAIQSFYSNPVTTSGSVTSTVSVSPSYVGERSGGANRSTIYGSARWGSGQGDISPGSYTFTPIFRLTDYSDCLPYGFWPIYWNSYHDGDPEHDYSFDPFRPGGAQNVLLAGLDETRQDAYYFVIADTKTIAGLNTILALPYEQGGCSMWSGNPAYAFNPDELAINGSRTLRSVNGENSRQNITMVPNNILQYYRGSSVALGANVYNNTHPLGGVMFEDYWFRTPFNVSLMLTGRTTVNRTEQEHTRFLDCLNQTIAAAIPIFDPTFGPFPDDKPFKIAVGVGVPLAVGAIILIICWRYRMRRTKRFLIQRAPAGAIGYRGGDEQFSMSTRTQADEQEGEGENLPVYTPAAKDGEKPPGYTGNSPG